MSEKPASDALRIVMGHDIKGDLARDMVVCIEALKKASSNEDKLDEETQLALRASSMRMMFLQDTVMGRMQLLNDQLMRDRSALHTDAFRANYEQIFVWLAEHAHLARRMQTIVDDVLVEAEQ